MSEYGETLIPVSTKETRKYLQKLELEILDIFFKKKHSKWLINYKK